MMRYLPSTPLFDERFVDYGCNKVQYIDRLRNMGRSDGRVATRISVLYPHAVLRHGCRSS